MVVAIFINILFMSLPIIIIVVIVFGVKKKIKSLGITKISFGHQKGGGQNYQDNTSVSVLLKTPQGFLKALGIDFEKVREFPLGDKTAVIYKLGLGLPILSSSPVIQSYLIEVPIDNNYGQMFIHDRLQHVENTGLQGYKTVELESVDFNKRYELSSPNEKLAWEFFSPDMMSILLDTKIEHFSINVFPSHLCFYLPTNMGTGEGIDEFMRTVKEVVDVVND